MMENITPGTPGVGEGITTRVKFGLMFQKFAEIINHSVHQIASTRDSLKNEIAQIRESLGTKNNTVARNRLHMMEHRILNLVGTKNEQITDLYRELDELDTDFETASKIRRHLDNWNLAKTSLYDALASVRQELEGEILLMEIGDYRCIINPIPLPLFAKAHNTSVDDLRVKVLGLLRAKKLEGRIDGEDLFLENREPVEAVIRVYKRFEIIGTRIRLQVRLMNPSPLFISDVNLFVTYPDELLTFLDRESNSLETIYSEFQPETAHTHTWIFQINNPGATKLYRQGKIQITVLYERLGRRKEIQKEIELII
jgi:hypothetical protein